MDGTKTPALEELRRKVSALEHDVQHLVNHDQLTGLLVRAAFLKRVEEMLQSQRTEGSRAAVIEIGIRGLPRITGALGRHVGDYVIAALAARLSSAVGSDPLVCRLDYLSFAIFVPRIGDALETLTFAKQIITSLSEPIDWVERTLTIDAGAGVALAGHLDTDAATLLHRAGLALKAATEKGGAGYAFFNPALEQAAKRRQDVQAALQESLANNYFRLHFQPFFHSRSGELAGFEALLRLNHPLLGEIAPAEFIPVAEESGVVNRIGAWALAEACRVASTWPSNLVVAVNFSPEQFLSGNLLTNVHNALELFSFPAYRLEIEITESTMLGDTEAIMSQIKALREFGCPIVLDDFGTGYSSLSYLWKFPFSKLKIDKSFVHAVETKPQVRGMLKSIIDLAANLGLKVTAEGIETTGQADLLKATKSDFLQGFLCGMPVSEDDLPAIIASRYAESLRSLRPSPADAFAATALRFEF